MGRASRAAKDEGADRGYLFLATHAGRHRVLRTDLSYVPARQGGAKISYKVELPPHFKIHPVFHASVFKPHHEDKEDTRRNQTRRAPITVTASHDREIEAIIDYQAKRKQGQQASAMFLVHWKGQFPEEATWEKYDDLWQFKDQVREFFAAMRRGRRIIRWGSM